MDTNDKKTRVKRSPIWTLSDEAFANIVKNAKRIKNIADALSVSAKGGNFRAIKNRIQSLGLDDSHLLNRAKSSGLSRSLSKEDFESSWLVADCSHARICVKKYLLRFGTIPYECSSCKNVGEWNGKKLVLQLEHKNGISNDNRISNLTFLCPNCHSQTETFAGRNRN